jgi:hypothetical protein
MQIFLPLCFADDCRGLRAELGAASIPRSEADRDGRRRAVAVPYRTAPHHTLKRQLIFSTYTRRGVSAMAALC